MNTQDLGETSAFKTEIKVEGNEDSLFGQEREEITELNSENISGKFNVNNMQDEYFVDPDKIDIKSEQEGYQFDNNEFNQKKITDENIDFQFIDPNRVGIKTELEEGYKFDNNEFNEEKDNPEYIIISHLKIRGKSETISEVKELNPSNKIEEESKFILPEKIYVKSEIEESCQSNTRRFDSEYDESSTVLFKCKHCHIGLSTEIYKNAHEFRCSFGKKEKQFREGPFECPYCKLLFGTEYDKNEHQAICKKRKHSKIHVMDTIEASEKKYSCDMCNHKTKRRSHLVAHIKSIHDKINTPKYSCSHCPYQTVSHSNLKRHLRTHTPVQKIADTENNPKFSCSQCPYQTLRNSNLKRHLRMHSTFGLICLVCEKSFNQKVQLDSHYVLAHPDKADKWQETITSKINECAHCGFKTVQTSHFKSHLARHEPSLDKYKFKCDVCGYQCVEKSAFTAHVRLHDGQLPFVCTECNKSFNAKRQLDGHIVSHHSDSEVLMNSVTNKVHRCDKCDYKTIRVAHLKYHLKACKYRNLINK